MICWTCCQKACRAASTLMDRRESCLHKDGFCWTLIKVQIFTAKCNDSVPSKLKSSKHYSHSWRVYKFYERSWLESQIEARTQSSKSMFKPSLLRKVILNPGLSKAWFWIQRGISIHSKILRNASSLFPQSQVCLHAYKF